MSYFTQTELKTRHTDDGAETLVDAVHPLPVNNDAIYENDVNFSVSDNGGFSGSVADYFESLETINYDNSATNPKTIKVRFKRSQQIASIGFGCNDGDANFSNIKISVLGSADTIRAIADHSDDDTKFNSKVINFTPEPANGVLIEFHTADPVGLSNLIIYKSQNRISRIQAIRPDGLLTDVGATNNDNLHVSVQEYGDTPAIDAFARLRIAEPYTLFDSKQLHDKQPLFWDEALGGSATSIHNPVNACTEMKVTADANDYVIRQTKQRFNYQPGKSQLIFMTFYSPQVTGITTRVGLFDSVIGNVRTPKNGIFFECDGTLSWNIAKNGTIVESVTQANWNVDPLDGTGPSGITLNMSAAQIMIIDYEWLGVGRVRVGFVIDGLVYYVHNFNHANDPLFYSVYMSTPNLPLRYSIETDGTAGSELDHICSTVISEGGVEETGLRRSIDTETTSISAVSANVPYAILGMKLKSAYSDITVIPEFFSMICTSNDDYRWSLHLNPELSAPLTYNNLDNSAIQYAIGSGETLINLDPSNKMDSGFVKGTRGGDAGRKFTSALRMGSNLDGTLDTIVLAATSLSSNAPFHGSLTYRELL